MVYADHCAGGTDEVCKHCGQVAGAGADVENVGAGMEVWEERFAGGGVHVRCGDCGFVAYGLWTVFVGHAGGEVCAVNLQERLLEGVGVAEKQ